MSAISIHALRKESDSAMVASVACRSVFQSTLSVRRATRSADELLIHIIISIHALRKESDCRWDSTMVRRWYFNPRSP